MSAIRVGSVLCVLLVDVAVGAGADDAWPPDRLFSQSEPWVQSDRATTRQSAAARGETSLAGAARRSAPAEQPLAAGVFEGEFRTAPQFEPREEQEEDHIETDRDSFTPATTTVGRGRLVLESAYTFVDNRKVAETHSYPETILRYGLTEKLEFRFGWNYEVGGAGNSTSGQEGGEPDEPEVPGPGGAGTAAPAEEARLERAARIAYGAKLAVTEQEGLFPESALIMQAYTPTEGPSNTTTFVGTYVLGWKLLSDCKLDAAVRYGTAEEEGDRFGNFAPSVVLRVPLGEKWNAHAEWFGIFSDHREEDSDIEYVSPGLHYLVTPDLEIGFRVGWGLTDQSAKFFCNSGLGLRF